MFQLYVMVGAMLNIEVVSLINGLYRKKLVYPLLLLQ